jgi:hypothetical protein
MNMKKMSLAAAAAFMLVPGVSAQTVWGTWEQPLEGRRFETMRALSHYLDEAAQDALAGVVQARRRGRVASVADRRYVTALRDFARRAEDLHTRMDDYDVTSFDIPDEVDYLTARARRVSQLVRPASAYANAQEDWDKVVEALGLMKRLLNGEDVEVPAAHDEYGDYDRDYGYLGRGTGGSERPGTLSGTRLQQFDDLARELEQQAANTLRTAERSTTPYGRAQAIVTDLRSFVERARDLGSRRGRGELASREVASLVDGLMQDARALDRRMRDARAFADAWADWARVIETLDRMGSLLR